MAVERVDLPDTSVVVVFGYATGVIPTAGPGVLHFFLSTRRKVRSKSALTRCVRRWPRTNSVKACLSLALPCCACTRTTYGGLLLRLCCRQKILAFLSALFPRMRCWHPGLASTGTWCVQPAWRPCEPPKMPFPRRGLSAQYPLPRATKCIRSQTPNLARSMTFVRLGNVEAPLVPYSGDKGELDRIA